MAMSWQPENTVGPAPQMMSPTMTALMISPRTLSS
jgi:hypothetical protein